MGTVTAPWDAEEYGEAIGIQNSGMNLQREAALMEMFPPIFNHVTFLYKPAIIVDKADHIICWYLPCLLGPEYRVSSSISA